jgi:aspartyl-tRNA synthetase
MNEDGPASPILKFLGAAVTQSIIDKVDAKTGDIIRAVVAVDSRVLASTLGAVNGW